MGAKHKNKRVGVRHERPRPGWTNAEIDFVLNEILPLDDPKKLHAVECRIAEQLDRGRELKQTHRDYGKGHSRKPVDLLIWKLASAYRPVCGYSPDISVRHDRGGLPFTWMEKRIIRIAFSPENDGQKRGRGCPTTGYIATLLFRTGTEVVTLKNSVLAMYANNSVGFGL